MKALKPRGLTLICLLFLLPSGGPISRNRTVGFLFFFRSYRKGCHWVRTFIFIEKKKSLEVGVS